MKILHVTYSGIGGAGIAARRSHEALTAAGVQSHLLCARNAPPGCDVADKRWLRKCWHAINYHYEKWRRRKLLAEDQILRSANILPGYLLKQIMSYDPDIVHLHWINSGTLSVSEIQRIPVPVVWTLHDMWPLTGSSHCAGSLLGKWRQAGMPSAFSEIDETGYCRKLEAIHDQKMADKPDGIISPSRWMHGQVGKKRFSKNKHVQWIPNCLDLEVFCPAHDQALAKKKLGLPTDKKVLLFVSSWGSSPVKGYDLIELALAALSDDIRQTCVIAILGRQRSSNEGHGFPVIYLGNREGDKALAEVYQAADVFLCPSREDNYPNTVMEASACGLPTVAFETGGLPDLVESGWSGMLAEPFDPRSFAECMGAALRDSDRMGKNALEKATQVNNPSRHAQSLARFYKAVLSE